MPTPNDGIIAAYADTLNSISPAGGSMAGPLTVNAQLTAQGLNGTGTAPVIAGVTHCVASAPAGHDLGGSFVLTTDSTSVTAGTIATVTFGTPLAAAPVAVIVTLADTTSTLTNVATVVASATATAITVKNTASMTVSHTFLVSYVVIAS